MVQGIDDLSALNVEAGVRVLTVVRFTKQEVTRVQEKDVVTFFPDFLDVGCFPGKTAKLSLFSPAGLSHPIRIVRTYNREIGGARRYRSLTTNNDDQQREQENKGNRAYFF